MAGRNHIATTNACKLCTPLGATLAFRGIEGAVPFLHGSQGCATYMRRYVISHYREPMDIASSALGEKHAIHGGGPNLKKGLLNVMKKYHPRLVGVATTCLTETIGDDVGRILREFRNEFGDLDLPDIVHVSTPSFAGTHMDGWYDAVRAVTEQLVESTPGAMSGAMSGTMSGTMSGVISGAPHEAAPGAAASGPATAGATMSGTTPGTMSGTLATGLSSTVSTGRTCLLPGLLSPADIRHLRDVMEAFGLAPVILPDISETLDAPCLEAYAPIPAGGTPLDDIRALGRARAVVEMGDPLGSRPSAGAALHARHGVPLFRVGVPVGLRETDTFMEALERISGTAMPPRMMLERGRLVDALVDGHKYVAGKRAVVYGDADMVTGLCAMLAETGIRPVLVATGARGCGLAARVAAVCGGLMPDLPEVREGVDFHEIAERAGTLAPDLLVGNSKGYRYARAWGIPLVRTGFPVHDRFGGQRLLHVGYTGALALYDRIVNALIERHQTASPVGYGYM